MKEKRDEGTKKDKPAIGRRRIQPKRELKGQEANRQAEKDLPKAAVTQRHRQRHRQRRTHKNRQRRRVT